MNALLSKPIHVIICIVMVPMLLIDTLSIHGMYTTVRGSKVNNLSTVNK